jgi:cytochrome c-type biogenesis protein CcmF
MTVPTAAVRYTAGHDLYLSIAGSIDPNADGVILRVIQSPLVTWIWIGAAILAFGTVWALVPARTPRRASVAVAGGERAHA